MSSTTTTAAPGICEEAPALAKVANGNNAPTPVITHVLKKKDTLGMWPQRQIKRGVGGENGQAGREEGRKSKALEIKRWRRVML
ncbi:uncharacterized protein MYCFIDRAFT_205509 [Pseudocercospora fijiensis CIRAD86]|uniref:Uncharacterized protein n=1 Tax=Pseudocercospora fijiensis (strain CIRAD86) TaxID=383855 RepID=M2ZDN7_PSEFD|nr:uncharacterized protein MYCFIDRAFT_205509 [Pseudocercospora fijiensis CIRAD86]EME77209.1 hypothetical protein MYCFIDRAFT_205509 [Pseudocercospora fijiensis CIRAD86]